MNKFKKYHTDKLRRRLILVGSVCVVTGVYIMHRGRLNAVIEMHQLATQETMWSSFDEGVKYGLALAKDPFIAGFGSKEISQYAFEAFDKST